MCFCFRRSLFFILFSIFSHLLIYSSSMFFLYQHIQQRRVNNKRQLYQNVLDSLVHTAPSSTPFRFVFFFLNNNNTSSRNILGIYTNNSSNRNVRQQATISTRSNRLKFMMQVYKIIHTYTNSASASKQL